MFDKYRYTLHSAVIAATPAVFLVSAINGGPFVYGAIFIATVMAFFCVTVVLTWQESIEDVARDVLPSAPPMFLRVAGGMLTLAACLLHEGPMAVALFAAVLADLCVSEVLYLKAEDHE